MAWLAVVLAAAGPVVGHAAYRAALQDEQRRILSRFGETVQERATALTKEVDGAIDAVTALAVVLDTFSPVGSGQFQRFASELLLRRPGLAALSSVAVVPSPDRERYELEVRQAGLAGYRITERLSSGELGPAAQREVYYPVSFIEPRAGNEPAVGFDLGSDPVRLAAVRQALRSGRPTISDPVRLVQETGTAKSLLILVAVHPASGDTVDGRRLESPGLASGVLRVEDVIVDSLLRGVRETPHEMAVELADERPDGTRIVLYSSPAADTNQTEGSWSSQAVIRPAGRRWVLFARPTVAYLSRERTVEPALIGLGVLTGWELLLALGLAVAKWSRERASRRETEFAASVIRSVAEGVLVADTTGRFVLVNEAAGRVVGRGRRQIPLADWSREVGVFWPGSDDLYPSERLPLARALRGEEVASTEVVVRNQQVPEGVSLSVTAAPLRDSSGVITGGVAVFRDITASKRAAELAQRLSNAVEQTADAVLITDRAGVIQYVNPAFETMTGYSKADTAGQTPRLLKSGKQGAEYYTALWSTLLRGETFKARIINRKKSGAHFWTEQTITPMMDDSTGEITHFVAVIRDMSDRMRLQEQEIEMKVGAAVQQRLFPQYSHLLPGYDLAGAASPALATCGDYYDFIWLPDGRLGIVIADVSGHGLGAALIMTMTRSYLHSLAKAQMSLDRLVSELNSLILSDVEEERFVTMVIVFLEAESGGLTWVSGGHPTGYVLDPRGEARERLKSTCLPLGLFPSLGDVLGRPVTLAPGEILLLVTDGILEAASPDGREFGSEAMLAVASSARDWPAQDIASRIIAEAKAFTRGQPQVDDFTVVVCKRNPCA
jgi:PAS domain S-box-containing protein